MVVSYPQCYPSLVPSPTGHSLQAVTFTTHKAHSHMGMFGFEFGMSASAASVSISVWGLKAPVIRSSKFNGVTLRCS
jgi:hypothetical protein